MMAPAPRIPITADPEDGLLDPARRPPDAAAAGLHLAGVVHDVNQMLTVIQGRAEHLLQAGPGEDRSADLAAIAQAARDAAAILGRLRGAQAVRASAADLRDCVDRAAAVMAPPAPARWQGAGATEGWVLANGVPADLGASVPATLVREVLHNLLANALSALPDGGRVAVTAAAAGDRVRLLVADDGPGLPAGAEERIFDPGTSGSGDPARGIGLAACRQLLREVGGDIEAVPSSLGGAAFAVDLPRAARESSATQPASAGLEAGPAPGTRILVVDDEPGVREMLGDVLASWGCQVVTAADAPAARAAWGDGGFALALVDRSLPGESGEALAAWLRRREPHLPVALMTGWNRADEPASTGTDAADFEVTKPLALTRLRELLHEAAALAADRERPTGTVGKDDEA